MYFRTSRLLGVSSVALSPRSHSPVRPAKFSPRLDVENRTLQILLSRNQAGPGRTLNEWREDIYSANGSKKLPELLIDKFLEAI